MRPNCRHRWGECLEFCHRQAAKGTVSFKECFKKCTRQKRPDWPQMPGPYHCEFCRQYPFIPPEPGDGCHGNILGGKFWAMGYEKIKKKGVHLRYEAAVVFGGEGCGTSSFKWVDGNTYYCRMNGSSISVPYNDGWGWYPVCDANGWAGTQKMPDAMTTIRCFWLVAGKQMREAYKECEGKDWHGWDGKHFRH